MKTFKCPCCRHHVEFSFCWESELEKYLTKGLLKNSCTTDNGMVVIRAAAVSTSALAVKVARHFSEDVHTYLMLDCADYLVLSIKHAVKAVFDDIVDGTRAANSVSDEIMRLMREFKARKQDQLGKKKAYVKWVDSIYVPESTAVLPAKLKTLGDLKKAKLWPCW